ncbi:MAG: hypothetical protein DCO96_04850 [Fluviicola sp. XM-24bin1]|nr:MAG: hypothetical protein DCO96_04850 [Fluviicola sp. XM-24bin1]
MTKEGAKKKGNNAGIIFISVLASLYAAFYNGFPLVYTDTGTYLRSGFEGEIPIDRPIFYGLFLRHISLSESLWLVIFVQALITCWLLHLISGVFFSGLKRNIVFLISIAFVTLTTGFSYNVSILIPDIFATIAFLAFVVMMLSQELNTLKWILVSIIFVFSLSTHYSNIPIFILLFLLVFFWMWRKYRKGEENLGLKRVLIAVGLFIFTMVMIPTVNYSYNGKFRYSESSHVFLFNHMIEIGAAQQYLTDNCDEKNYAICQYREELEWDFLWNYDSPLYKTGGWKKNEKDFNEINNGIIFTPKYWPLLIHKTTEYTAKQLFLFETEVQGINYEGTPCVEIEKYLNKSLREIRGGKQVQGRHSVEMLNSVEGVIVFLSTIFILLLTVLSRKLEVLSKNQKLLLKFTLAYAIINALVCANLSTAIPRYHNRFAWVLVIVSIYFLVSLYKERSVLLGSKEIE